MTQLLEPPRVESLSVKNYRALRNVRLDHMTPLTVLLGPNGSGKSTVFDVFAFLSECFGEGLRKAWDRRGQIFETLRRRIPRIEKVTSRPLDDGRLLLQVKDAPFSTPILARFASDGTLKMLAYLTLLYDPTPPN